MFLDAAGERNTFLDVRAQTPRVTVTEQIYDHDKLKVRQIKYNVMKINTDKLVEMHVIKAA
jgi:hypothetical protein